MTIPYRALVLAWSLVTSTFASQLLSNYTYAVTAGPNPSELWVLTRGDADSSNGYSIVTFSLDQSLPVVADIASRSFPKGFVGVHDNIFIELSGELRRTVSVRAGSQLLAQGFSADSSGGLTAPTALLRTSTGSSNAFGIDAAGLDSNAVVLWPRPVEVAAHDIAVDRDGSLWIARGPWGILHVMTPPARWTPTRDLVGDTADLLLLHSSASSLLPTSQLDSLDSASLAPVWALALDTSRGTLWLGSERGLWRGHRDSLALHKVALGGIDTLRISGVWISPSGASLIVESSRAVSGKSSAKTVSSLWRSTNYGNSFEAIQLPYDSMDVSVSAAAFIGPEVWLSVQGIGSTMTGLLRIGPSGPRSWKDSISIESDANPYIWGMEAGVVDRSVAITSVAAFPLGSGLGLAVSTNGAGIAVSADSGLTWKQVLNQKAVKNGLAEVRMIPSVMRYAGATSLIAYRLSQSGKVTIEVFSYDMRKVRTVVRNAARSSDPIRSSKASEDFWDGRDDAGNPCALGMYYVKVHDNHGHQSFGKVMWLGGLK